MGAPKAMSNQQTKQQSGFKKFFSRKQNVAATAKKSDPLQVAAGVPPHFVPPKPEKSLSAARAVKSSRKNKLGLLGGWSSSLKKEGAASSGRPESPVASPSSGSSDDVQVFPSKFASQNENERISSIRPIHDKIAPASAANASPNRDSLFQWQDNMEQQQELSVIRQKQQIKERDGFCRRVDKYDGSVIRVEGKACYELGNYLGGGVAGVVYEGHRLLPESEYPVRRGLEQPTPSVIDTSRGNDLTNRVNSLLSCVPGNMCHADNTEQTTILTDFPINPDNAFMIRDQGSMLTADSYVTAMTATHTDSVALEAVHDMVLIDGQDAPSRSKHLAKAVKAQTKNKDFPSDGSFTNGFMEEAVAIKILNPVGFRTLAPEVTDSAVVAREGAPLSPDCVSGKTPMEEKHVWWLINPSSRNLRTLQRYSIDAVAPRGVEVDRGSAEKGLRISLIAAYKDPITKKLRELPLTRCIEIWGHVPFEASDAEFRDVMAAIDRINQGFPPPAIDLVPGRVGTATSSMGSSSIDMDNLHLTTPTPMVSKRTGIYRAASTFRTTVFCKELQAYIALPAVPSKYLKWLRQRRAATKEIRNMMLIGRHRNVVHLFEVLELIQETKSTMFLILELVRGGELFDLISSNAAKISSKDKVPVGFTESETVMRKFFLELASGIHYCHGNNIAHRDLKPENLLVHNGQEGNCTLKIADFGLSAVFGPNGESFSDQDTVVESYVSGPPILMKEALVASHPVSPIKQQVDKLINAGSTALGFLTCGAVEDIISCGPSLSEAEGDPSPLKRMTSVVGSPHYVAPEIISQHDKRGGSKKKDATGDIGAPVTGYDGTKADVWSAGVILYAMLFRSLPFGEDLLRCPRYQSFKKWYDEVKKHSGARSRRSDLMAPLNPIITEAEGRELLGPQWFFPSDSSPESRDLIVYMLNPDPDKRPSIQLVLQHPWLLKKAL